MENPVGLNELDLIVIDPLTPYVWYQDMVDFTDGISDRGRGTPCVRNLRHANELARRSPNCRRPAGSRR
jgi:hypothetical protein